jgi:hypothetical protein
MKKKGKIVVKGVKIEFFSNDIEEYEDQRL